MDTKQFSVGEALRFGWHAATRNLGLFIGVMIAFVLVESVPGVFEAMLPENRTMLVVAIQIVFSVLSIILQIGLFAIALRITKNEPVEFIELFAHADLFWKYLGGSLLYMLITFVGTLLLIVPGIIWALKYQFFGLAIVDEGLGPIQALKRSGEMTQGAKSNLFAFAVVIGLVNMLGVLAFVIGVFITVPLTIVATTYVYRQLMERNRPAIPAPASAAPVSP